MSGLLSGFVLFIKKWKLDVVIALVLVSALFSLPVYGQGGSGEQQPVSHRKVPSLDVIMLVDESETMWNHTDTEGVRVNTVNFFIDMLSSEQSGSVHRLGIVAFGTESHVIPYVLLDSQAAAGELKEQYAAVHKSIESHKDEEYTDINKALRAALAMIECEWRMANGERRTANWGSKDRHRSHLRRSADQRPGE